MRKKINLEQLLMIFIVLQPFLDFYMLYSESVVNIFKFSPSTIIRIFFIGVFMVYILFKIKYNKKYFWILGYLLLVVIYLVIHIINSLNFNISIGEQFSFSYLTEILYFIRLFIPLLMIFITYHTNLKECNFKKTILIVSLVFSLQIVITNIFKISLTSYGGTKFIEGNIFSWFVNNNYSFEQLASKGWFYMANQISGVLFLLLPINIYYAVKSSSKSFILSSTSISIAMTMLGTRIATYGWFLITFMMFIVWVFFAIIHKNKINITPKKTLIYAILTIFLVFVTLKSPLIEKRATVEFYENIENSNLTISIKNKFNNIKSNSEMKQFIKQYSDKYSIPLVYIETLYPYNIDTKFWAETIKLPYSERGGNRNLENLITKRVYKLNNNEYDKYFGMGYSRFRNAQVYIEQDFKVHFYTLGIVGIILFILPYLFISTFSLLYMLKNKIFRMRTLVLCLSIYLVLGISYFSGHILDELIVTIILGFICGFVLRDTILRKKNKDIQKEKLNKINIPYNKNKPYVSVIVPVYNVEKYLEKCLNSLANQTLKNIEVIIVNDGTKDNSQKIIDKFCKKYNNFKSYIKENGGLSSARNYGINKAKGNFITFLDSDDYVEFNIYEELYLKSIENNYDVVVCDLFLVFNNNKRVIRSNVEKDLIDLNDIKKSMINVYPVAWNKLYKKNLFKNVKFKNGIWYEDVEFLYNLYPYIKSIGVVNKPLVNYVQREGAITSIFDKRIYNYIDNWNSIIKNYKSTKKFKKYKEELEYCYVRYIYATFIKGLAKTRDKNEFNNGIDIAIEEVNNKFPNYKNNKYINKFSIKNLYLKFFSKKISKIVYFFINIKK